MGGEGRLDFFQKFIRFGTATLPLYLIVKLFRSTILITARGKIKILVFMNAGGGPKISKSGSPIESQ